MCLHFSMVLTCNEFQFHWLLRWILSARPLHQSLSLSPTRHHVLVDLVAQQLHLPPPKAAFPLLVGHQVQRPPPAVDHNCQMSRTGLEKLYQVVSVLFFYAIYSSHTSKTGSQMPPPKVPAKRRRAPTQEVNDDHPLGSSPLTENLSPKPVEPTPRNKRQKTKAVGTRKSQRTRSQVAADN